MTQTIDHEVAALRTRVTGTVLLPGDDGYDAARTLWHGDIDRRPAVIVRCAGPDDVAAALAYARRTDREVFVRGGGHGPWGGAAAVMIDLSALDSVTVDPDTRRARVGGGATLGQMDAATQKYGLAVPAGTVSNTGVGGITLGGGFGWLTPQFGLTLDSLESAEVVLADGRVVRASGTEHADLFWALRGGGGNFGVVTEFEFRCHPVGPTVHVAMLFATANGAAAALRGARDVIPSLDRTITVVLAGMSAPPAPFVPPELHGQPMFAVAVGGFGSAEEHAAAVEALRAAAAPAFETVMSLPYVELQQFMDDAQPWGVHEYGKGLYLTELTDPVADELAARLPLRRSPMSQVGVFLFRGAYGEVPDDATAFGGARDARYFVVIHGVTTDAGIFAEERRWVRDTWSALRPHAADGGGYVNLTTEYEEGGVGDTYGAAKHARLREIKARYDPTNVFRHSVAILPAEVTA